ncbi:MAG TPA: DUF1080 domain-containing protein [Vicinamibacterales bacterium]|nr:DUF1080 domain-containing protein [Vicinamibacterales bacterium]
MKNARWTCARTALASLVLLAVLAPAPAWAQDNRTLATKVADILALFPAGSGEDRDKLADQMIALGEPGLAEFTRRLAPAGSGDDTAVRYAVNAMAVHAARAGNEPKRAVAERALVTALGSATDVEVKTFLLSQLRVVGREAAVKAASPLLADAATVEPATQLLLTVKGPLARTALAAALDKAQGPARITIVKAIGELGAVEANQKLLAFAADPDPAMRRPALAALARLASPRSFDALTGAATKAGFKYEPGNAIGSLLNYAARLGQTGNASTAEKVCRLVMRNTDAPGLLGTRAAALAILADVRGPRALPELIAAVDHADVSYRHAALARAEKIRSAVAVNQWVAKAEKVDPVRRAEIVAMLGRQGDRRSLPFIRASLASADPAVALAAAEGLALMEGPAANEALVGLLKSRSAADAQHVADILLWTTDAKALDPLVPLLQSGEPAQKAAAVRVLGARGGSRFAAQVLPLASDANPEVRAAAYGALAGVAGPGDLPALLKLVDAAPDAQLARNAQRAVVASAEQVTPEEARARPIIAAMDGAVHPERLLEVLPQVGGKEALDAVVSRFEGGSGDTKGAAFRALVQWRGPEAADRLFAIVSAGEPAYRDMAFGGFVRQIGMSSLPDEQKVLQLRRVLPLAKSANERRMIIRSLQRTKTFQAFLVASSLMDDAEVANDAAGAVMTIALPAAGEKNGLTGKLVRNALERVIQVLTGGESDYDKENIKRYLAAMPPDEGFVPIFNGTDLTGWQGLVENPIVRAKMSPQDLAARQPAADAKMRENWGVRSGMIVFNGSGDNLCTVKEYGDFEMLVDWRITKDGDSGIYLRGTPQVQIWDPARVDVGAQVGSGGLYNNQKNPSKPLVFADNPVGEWNTFRIVMIGEKVTVFLNGVKVVDNVTMENYWDRSQPIFARGPIELQAHGTDLQFRDIYVREIGAEASQGITPEEKAEGFVALFDGTNLDQWIGNKTGYKVENGMLVFDPKAPDTKNIYTAKEYGDFVFRFEFQLTPGANSGVGIRTPPEGDAAYVGMEIQILDNDAPVYAKLQPYQYHGSVYGIIPAKRGALKPVGEWNTEEIFIQGSKIRITVNGQVIVDGDLVEATKNGTMDHKDHPGLQRKTGHIGFLSHGAVVKFRNIRIKDLTK